MRKRRARATSLEHGGRESGNRNKGKLSSPWGICVCVLEKEQHTHTHIYIYEIKPLKRVPSLKMTLEMNEGFLLRARRDPCSYTDAPTGGDKSHMHELHLLQFGVSGWKKTKASDIWRRGTSACHTLTRDISS